MSWFISIVLPSFSDLEVVVPLCVGVAGGVDSAVVWIGLTDASLSFREQSTDVLDCAVVSFDSEFSDALFNLKSRGIRIFRV